MMEVHTTLVEIYGQTKGWQTSVKGQRVKILGYLVSVTTTKLILVKAAIDNTQTSGLGCAEIKLYL